MVKLEINGQKLQRDFLEELRIQLRIIGMQQKEGNFQEENVVPNGQDLVPSFKITSKV